MTDSDLHITSMRTSTRDRAALRERLQRWLARALGPGADPEVSALASPGGAGLSSETLLFDLAWRTSSERQHGSYVARLHPAPDSMPVFPVYDFDRQVRVLRLVAERSTGRRSVYFGEQPMPAGPQELIYHRNLIERALDGTPDPWV